MISSQTFNHSPVPSEITDFHDWICQNYEHGIDGMPFMAPSTLGRHLDQPPRLKSILNAIGASTIDTDTVRRRYKAILAILILCEGTMYLEHFTKHPNLCDDKLPFLAQPDHFHSDDLWARFSQHQWHFCAHKFLGDLHTNLDHRTILPFLTQDSKVSGGTAEVSRVTIHPDFKSFDPQANSRKFYALKTFHQSEARAKPLYEAEIAAFRYLKGHGAQPDLSNIIAFHGGFRQNDRYSILLEYAECGTLEQFFGSHSKIPHGQDLIPLWEGMMGLCTAVFTVHNVPVSTELMEAHNRVIFKGWHQDVKPDNILVFPHPDHPGRYIFKLADFGASHFRSFTADQDGSIIEPTVDKDSRGTRVYGSPECYRGHPFQHIIAQNVGQSTDIWSLGAIYSEFVVWSVLGQAGLEMYRDARLQATKAISGHQDPGCFHDRQELLPCVKEAHAHALQEARSSDTITELIVADILPRMLCNTQGRLTARQLDYYLEVVLLKAKAKQETAVQRLQSSLATLQKRISQELPLERALSINSPARSAAHTSHVEHVRHDDSASVVTGLWSQRPILPFIRTDTENYELRDGDADRQQHKDSHASASIVAPQRRSFAALPQVNTVNPIAPQPSPIRLSLASVEEQMNQDKQRLIWRLGRGKFKSLLANLDPDYTIRNLGNRDHIVLVDDSQSMDQHWRSVKSLFKGLAWLVSGDDDDGVELRFLRSMKSDKSKDPFKLAQYLDKVRRTGESDINRRLSEVLEAYSHSYAAWYSDSQRSSSRRSWLKRPRPEPKKLSIYVLTDAKWQKKSDAAESIKYMVDKLVQWQCSANRVGIQFIRFGDDPRSIAKLQRLDSKLGLQRDIVDHEPSTGCLLKMINGSIDKNADADSPSGSEEFESESVLPKTMN